MPLSAPTPYLHPIQHYLTMLSPKLSLNKAWLKVKPLRTEIEQFKQHLVRLLSRIDEKESEENIKGHLMEFQRDTWSKPVRLVATKSRTDFVIHNGNTVDTPAMVLFEVKRPANKADMINTDNSQPQSLAQEYMFLN